MHDILCSTKSQYIRTVDLSLLCFSSKKDMFPGVTPGIPNWSNRPKSPLCENTVLCPPMCLIDRWALDSVCRKGVDILNSATGFPKAQDPSKDEDKSKRGYKQCNRAWHCDELELGNWRRWQADRKQLSYWTSRRGMSFVGYDGEFDCALNSI